MLSGKNEVDDARCLDVLILYAEHGFNASTFTARTWLTLSDLHSCITGAIGALRGSDCTEGLTKLQWK